jgi:CRISPR-associated exonuclease Cas4
MFGVPVPEGALFYGENRRRTVVAIDAGLRALTEATAASARAMIAAGRTPAPVFTAAACNTCSLLDLCRPQALARPPRIAGWLGRQLGD